MMDGTNMNKPEVATLTADLFMERLDAAFTLVAGDISMSVILAACRENPDGAGPDSIRTPFSLTFRAEEDNAHPMQNARTFAGDVTGLPTGAVEQVTIVRTLRPRNQPPGAYFQVTFN